MWSIWGSLRSALYWWGGGHAAGPHGRSLLWIVNAMNGWRRSLVQSVGLQDNWKSCCGSNWKGLFQGNQWITQIYFEKNANHTWLFRLANSNRACRSFIFVSSQSDPIWRDMHVPDCTVLACVRTVVRKHNDILKVHLSLTIDCANLPEWVSGISKVIFPSDILFPVPHKTVP